MVPGGTIILNQLIHVISDSLTPGLPPLSRPHQGQGGTQRRLRQAQRPRRPAVRRLGGISTAICNVGCRRWPMSGSCEPWANPPGQRFEWERERLTPVGRRPPFGTPEDLTRIVSRDCVVALDTNCHSVPWHLVGELVRLSVTIERVRVYHGSALVANHARCTGRHQRRLETSHFDLREAMPASGSPSPTDPTGTSPV